jgi:hypothetical protein
MVENKNESDILSQVENAIDSCNFIDIGAYSSKSQMLFNLFLKNF